VLLEDLRIALPEELRHPLVGNAHQHSSASHRSSAERRCESTAPSLDEASPSTPSQTSSGVRPRSRAETSTGCLPRAASGPELPRRPGPSTASVDTQNRPPRVAHRDVDTDGRGHGPPLGIKLERETIDRMRAGQALHTGLATDAPARRSRASMAT
jgi:hypothetical protein